MDFYRWSMLHEKYITWCRPWSPYGYPVVWCLLLCGLGCWIPLSSTHGWGQSGMLLQFRWPTSLQWTLEDSLFCEDQTCPWQNPAPQQLPLLTHYEERRSNWLLQLHSCMMFLSRYKYLRRLKIKWNERMPVREEFQTIKIFKVENSVRTCSLP